MCSKPNRILHDANWKGITFLGRAPGERELIDDRLYYGDDYASQLFHVPCGQCDDCLIQRRYERATRIMLETLCYTQNCFVTLTYDQDHLGSGDLVEDHVTQFKKDIRRIYGQAQYTRLGRNPSRKVSSYTFRKFKFVTTGEYGDAFGRKHYHLIIFGLDFKDREHVGFSKKGNPIFLSQELKNVWKKGNCQVETVTHDLALYVGKYITDGWEDSEIPHERGPYSSVSNGIGLTYFKKYYRSIYAVGKLMYELDGLVRESPIPRIFHRWLTKIDPLFYSRWKSKRAQKFNESLKFKKVNKQDGNLAAAIRKGQITNLIHSRRREQDGKQ